MVKQREIVPRIFAFLRQRSSCNFSTCSFSFCPFSENLWLSKGQKSKIGSKQGGKARKTQPSYAVLGSRRLVNQRVCAASQLAWAQLQVSRCMTCILPRDDITGKWWEREGGTSEVIGEKDIRWEGMQIFRKLKFHCFIPCEAK